MHLIDLRSDSYYFLLRFILFVYSYLCHVAGIVSLSLFLLLCVWDLNDPKEEEEEEKSLYAFIMNSKVILCLYFYNNFEPSLAWKREAWKEEACSAPLGRHMRNVPNLRKNYQQTIDDLCRRSSNIIHSSAILFDRNGRHRSAMKNGRILSAAQTKKRTEKRGRCRFPSR